MRSNQEKKNPGVTKKWGEANLRLDRVGKAASKEECLCSRLAQVFNFV